MKKGWVNKKLGELIELKYGKGLPKRQRIMGVYPVYGSAGIVGHHETSLVKGPGIVVGRKGNVGSVYYSENDFFPIDTVFFIENKPEKYDLKFVYYLLKDSQSLKYSSDAAVPGLNREYALSRYFSIPDKLFNQQKIATFLSNYDDLIENNKKKIQFLEKIAKLIYDEWFVKFKFPGYEKVKMKYNEKLKKEIPERWTVKSITNIQHFQLIDKNIREFIGEREYFATANVSGIEIIKEGIKYNYKGKPSRAQKEPVSYSTWFARMKDTYKVLGFTSINENIAKKSILSSGFAGFKSDKVSFPFLYYTINSKYFHKEKDRFATGATQVSLNNKSLSKIKIILPTYNLIRLYGEVILSLINDLLLLQIRNKNLRKTRDLLLPRLIKGQIDVSNLNIKVPEVEA